MSKVDWSNIDTVLLDMDGTLIDLAFDSHFWLQQVPESLSQKQGITLEAARERIKGEYHAVRHTLNWYCFDYWSQQLDLDISQMTVHAASSVRVREDTVPFLHALRQSGRHTILLTNAHPTGLAIKMQHTKLDQHLDLLLSTHTFGYPKEDQRLWQAVQQQTGFDPERTLFVDDVELLLDAAQTFGIRHRLGIENPDSGRCHTVFTRHPSVSDYRQLLPAIQQDSKR